MLVKIISKKTIITLAHHHTMEQGAKPCSGQEKASAVLAWGGVFFARLGVRLGFKPFA